MSDDKATDARALISNDMLVHALELRRGGATLESIGDLFGVPASTVRGWILKYMRDNPADGAAALREQEMAQIEEHRKRIRKLLTRQYVQISAGKVVMVPARAPDGGFRIDPVTNMPIMVELEDIEPLTKLIALDSKLGERMVEMMGAKKAQPVAPTGPGQGLLGGGTQHDPERDKAIVMATLRELGLGGPQPAAQPVTDLEPNDVRSD